MFLQKNRKLFNWRPCLMNFGMVYMFFLPQFSSFEKCEYIEATGSLDDGRVDFEGLLGIAGGTNATCVAFHHLPLRKIQIHF